MQNVTSAPIYSYPLNQDAGNTQTIFDYTGDSPYIYLKFFDANLKTYYDVRNVSDVHIYQIHAG